MCLFEVRRKSGSIEGHTKEKAVTTVSDEGITV